MILPGLSGFWHIQTIVLECLCSMVTMGRDLFLVDDIWHCHEHRRASIKIVAVKQATLAEQAEISRVDSERSIA